MRQANSGKQAPTIEATRKYTVKLQIDGNVLCAIFSDLGGTGRLSLSSVFSTPFISDTSLE
jgi:hypothetical protein